MGFLDRFRTPRAAAGMRRPNYRNTAVIERIEKEEGVDRDTAIAWFDEMLVFLDMCAASDKVLSPSKPVDAAWHAFLLHSQDYEAYCTQRFGRVIHHQPTGEPDPHAYARAFRWRTQSGYGYVDPMIWPAVAGGAVLADAVTDGPSFTYTGDPGAVSSDAPTATGGEVQSFGPDTSGGGDSGGGSSCGGGGDSGGSSCGSSCGGGGD